MSTAIALKPADMSPEQLKLITDTVARGASPDELKLFLYRSKNMGLDPLKPGQIHFIKYGSGPGTIVVGIEGFRSIAQRTGKVSGVKTGVIKDEKGAIQYGWAEISRSDWKDPARTEVPFAEYNTGKGPWAKMPETMIKKVAECAAYRMAFPNDLGGVYEQSEMDQAGQPKNAPGVFPEQPTEGDGFAPPADGVYRIDFGKYNRKSLSEIYFDPKLGPKAIMSYIQYLEDAAQKAGKQLGEQALRFISEADKFLGEQEKGPREPGL